MGSRIHELRVCYPIKYSWFPARHNSGRGPPEPSALLFSKRAVHPWPTPRPLRPPPPRRRCAAATTPAAPRARAAGAASASLASRAGSHVPSSHDCCRSRCASVDVLAGIACAPAGWGCAGTIVCSFSHRCFRTLPEPAAAVPVFGGRDLRHGFAPTASSPFGAAPAESWA